MEKEIEPVNDSRSSLPSQVKVISLNVLFLPGRQLVHAALDNVAKFAQNHGANHHGAVFQQRVHHHARVAAQRVADADALVPGPQDDALHVVVIA